MVGFFIAVGLFGKMTNHNASIINDDLLADITFDEETLPDEFWIAIAEEPILTTEKGLLFDIEFDEETLWDESFL